MTLRSRLRVLAVVLALGTAGYGVVRINSPVLVQYVVERTLVEKAPPGTDPIELENRFRAMLARAPSHGQKAQILLDLAGRLEKVQQLSPGELERLLTPGK